MYIVQYVQNTAQNKNFYSNTVVNIQYTVMSLLYRNSLNLKCHVLDYNMK
jgi:hypothetical protein